MPPRPPITAPRRTFESGSSRSPGQSWPMKAPTAIMAANPPATVADWMKSEDAIGSTS
jgi:hypothetical protein